jgi:small subunit ribosomal protein S16e
VAFAKQGRGLIKVNGQPIENIEPEALRLKVFEPVLIIGQEKFSNLDIRIRVKGGGIVSQIYAIRAAIAKSIVAYHANPKSMVDDRPEHDSKSPIVETRMLCRASLP